MGRKKPEKAVTTNPNQNKKQSRERAQIGTVFFWEIQLMRWARPGWQLLSYNHNFQISEIVSSFITENESWCWKVLRIHWKKVNWSPFSYIINYLVSFPQQREEARWNSCLAWVSTRIWRSGRLDHSAETNSQLWRLWKWLWPCFGEFFG